MCIIIKNCEKVVIDLKIWGYEGVVNDDNDVFVFLFDDFYGFSYVYDF